MNKVRLSDREFDVMQILWRAERPLLASEILKEKDSLNINTIQSTLRKLLSRDFVRVADIVQSGKVLSRTYEPVISADEYIIMEYRDILPTASSPGTHFFAAFLEKSCDKEKTLQELEQLIQDYRKGLVK